MDWKLSISGRNKTFPFLAYFKNVALDNRHGDDHQSIFQLPDLWNCHVENDYLLHALFGRCIVSFGLLSIDRSGTGVHTHAHTLTTGYKPERYLNNIYFTFRGGNSDDTDGLDHKMLISIKMVRNGRYFQCSY